MTQTFIFTSDHISVCLQVWNAPASLLDVGLDEPPHFSEEMLSSKQVVWLERL